MHEAEENAHTAPVTTGRDAGLLSAVAFRELMRGPASSVVVVATGSGAGRSGCTVTAICSLSDAPPSVLVCLNRRSAALAAILANGKFSANYLKADQSPVADIFAGRMGLHGAGRFGDDWIDSPNGMPRFEPAMAWVECMVAGHHQYGSHEILLGRVIDGSSVEAAPLLYSTGRYQVLENSV